MSNLPPRYSAPLHYSSITCSSDMAFSAANAASISSISCFKLAVIAVILFSSKRGVVEEKLTEILLLPLLDHLADIQVHLLLALALG